VRFFTLDRWRGCQTGDAGDPGAGYARHLDSIRALLPADLLALQESISLHDARLRQLVVLPAEAGMRLVLDSYAGDERFTLTYSEVERVESTADPEAGLGGPQGYGDLGYDEVDVLPSGALEHRLLFSSGIELAVMFRGFALRRESPVELE
jgi:hypothetical protein